MSDLKISKTYHFGNLNIFTSRKVKETVLGDPSKLDEVDCLVIEDAKTKEEILVEIDDVARFQNTISQIVREFRTSSRKVKVTTNTENR